MTEWQAAGLTYGQLGERLEQERARHRNVFGDEHGLQWTRVYDIGSMIALLSIVSGELKQQALAVLRDFARPIAFVQILGGTELLIAEVDAPVEWTGPAGAEQLRTGPDVHRIAAGDELDHKLLVAAGVAPLRYMRDLPEDVDGNGLVWLRWTETGEPHFAEYQEVT